MFKAGTETASAEAACLNPGNRRGRRIKRTVAAIRRVKRMQVGMNNDISSGGVAMGGTCPPNFVLTPYLEWCKFEEKI
jgi:hypothetical protein